MDDGIIEEENSPEELFSNPKVSAPAPFEQGLVREDKICKQQR